MKKFNLILIVFALFVSSVMFGQDGTLDTTFGNNGIVETNIHDNLRQIKVLDNNKMLFLWYSYSDSLFAYRYSFISKFNDDGSPDISFGDNGTVALHNSIGDSTEFYYSCFDVFSNGKILVSKSSIKITSYIHHENLPDSVHLITNSSIIRLNEDGSLDTQFGVDGEMNIHSFDGIVPESEYTKYISWFLSVIVRSDDSFIVRWNPDSFVSDDGNHYAEVRCYNYNGELITDWGDNGIITVQNYTYYNHYNYDMIDKNDNYYYYYRTYDRITKYNSNGDIDYSFGSSGSVTLDSTYFDNNIATFNDCDIDSTGRTLYYFRGADYIFILRLSESGFRDTTFGENGLKKIPNQYYSNGDMLLMPDDNIIITYENDRYYPEDRDFFIEKFYSNGSHNTTFGGTGVISIDLGQQGFENRDILLMKDNKLLLVNKELSNAPLISFMRYNNSRSYSSLHVSGDVSGVWDVDTIYVDGDITVPQGETLTIVPGTVVYFTDWYKFDVQGQLIAEGTEEENIIFDAPEDVVWHGIRFYHTDDNYQPVSSVKYCQITKVGGGNWGNPGWPALYFVHSTASVSDTKIFRSSEEPNYSMSVINSGGTISNTEFNDVSPIFIDSSSTPVFTNCNFDSTSISIYNSSPTIDSCEISNAWNGSGTVGIYGSYSSPKISHTIVKNCASTGVWFQYSEPEFEFVTLENNSGVYGGGGYFLESTPSFKNVIVKGNTATQAGGGLFFNASSNWSEVFMATLDNCLIVGNTVTLSNKRGAGLYFGLNTKCTATITNCTIADNVSDDWAGISSSDQQPPIITNSIVWNNGGNLDFQAGGLYAYSIIQGNYVGQDTATTNLDNIDPLFRDGANGDYHLQSTACGYNANSPGIDAGHPTINDFLLDCGTAGLGDFRSDIGAYGGANNWWDHSILPGCYYSGEVSGVWDCDTIHVVGDILVPQDETLEITDNVKKIIFTGAYQIKVEGTLLAHGPEDGFNGLSGDYISFTGSGWRGILFNNLNGTGQQTSVIENCRFDYADKMDMPYQGGGAIAIYNSDSVIIRNSVFYQNKAKYGGAMYVENSNAVIENCYFANNGYITNSVQTEAGGALYIKNSNPYTRKLQLINNKSISGGGAIIFDNSSPIISNYLIVKNSTEGLGGAAQLVNGSSPKFVNLTVAENTAGAACGGMYLNPNSNPEIINSIFYGDTKPEIYLGGGTPIVTYSLVDSASNESWFGTGCLDEEPYFKMTVGNYYYLSTMACGDGVNSPAIDAGHPDSVDAVIDCHQGLGTARADMGYYGGRYSLVPVGVEEENINETPKKFELSQNYPNPFNPTSTISYSIPSVIARSEATRQSDGLLVQLKVYDALGREIATLVNQKQAPGKYSVNFKASNLASGIYFYTLRAGSFVQTRKMVLMK